MSLDVNLDGQVAIVTGAGSSGSGVGTGKASALLLARAGANVLVVDRFAERAGETVGIIEQEGGKAASFAADVSQQDDCEKMVEAARTAFGTVSILVNNVGIAILGPGAETPLDMLGVNVLSVIYATEAASEAMREAGGGAVVNIGSIAADRSLTRRPNVFYTASKGAVHSLTRELAGRHGASGIRVNCVAPGPIRTPLVSRLMDSAEVDRRQGLTPMGVGGDAWDIAWAVAFLVGPGSKWISGVTLTVDGGLLATTALTVAA